MPNKTVLAPAMHCEHCKTGIESEIAKLPGVEAVHADLATKTVHVMWNAPQAWPTIADRLSELGYPPQPLHEIKRHVAIVLYDGFTALDAVGPYEVLVSLPDTQVHFIADQHGPVWTDTGQLGLVATATWEELPNPQIILTVKPVKRGGNAFRQFLIDGILRLWAIEGDDKDAIADFGQDGGHGALLWLT